MKNINYYFIYIFFQIKRGNNNPIIKGTKMGGFYVKSYCLFATRDINFYVPRCINEEWIFLREKYIYICIYLLIYFYSTRSRIKKSSRIKGCSSVDFERSKLPKAREMDLRTLTEAALLRNQSQLHENSIIELSGPLIVVNCAFYDRALWTVCVPLIKSSFYAE